MFPTADFQEREVYDFFGIVFRGHPDLRRILMPEDYVGFPQRRDFPVGGDPVIFTNTEDEVPGWTRLSAELRASTDGSPTRPRADERTSRTRPARRGDGPRRDRAHRGAGRSAPRRSSDTALEREEELFTINMGPHHPATHGVLRLLVSLEGEVVRDLKPVMGYVHTGIEKSCEEKSYWKVIPFVERMDYLSYFFNARPSAAPSSSCSSSRSRERAKYLRVIHMELNRIHSHLVWLGTTALDLGAISMFWYCFRERDKILDLFEMSSGQRMHTRYFQVGGVIEDIPLGFEQKVRGLLRRDAEPDRPVHGAARPQRDLPLARPRAVGIVSTRAAARARRHRAAAARRRRALGPAQDRPTTSPTRSFDFDIPIGTVGDNYDRYRVRIAEMRESVKIISQAIEGLPEGPWIADDRKIVLPPRHELGTSMEALIHHFKLVTEGFRVPPGEVYNPIEGPRGELGCFVVADGSAKPARVHFRDPSFVNLQALKDMCMDEYVADLIANLAMLDPILGGIDR